MILRIYEVNIVRSSSVDPDESAMVEHEWHGKNVLSARCQNSLYFQERPSIVPHMFQHIFSYHHIK